MARPAIAAGILLAVMDTLADFGTVQFWCANVYWDCQNILRSAIPLVLSIEYLTLGCVFFLLFSKSSRGSSVLLRPTSQANRPVWF